MNILYLWTGYDTKHRKISVEEREGVLTIVVDDEVVFTDVASQPSRTVQTVPLTVEFVNYALAECYRRRARFSQNLATFGKVPAGAIHNNEKDIVALRLLRNNPAALNGDDLSGVTFRAVQTSVVPPPLETHHTDIRTGGHFSEGTSAEDEHVRAGQRDFLEFPHEGD